MPLRANLLDLIVCWSMFCFNIVNVWAFLVFCSFRGTVNVRGKMSLMWCKDRFVLYTIGHGTRVPSSLEVEERVST